MNKNRSVNILLPLALMLCFALCAVTVLLFAANVYSSAASGSLLGDTSRTALAYISEKIHRCDENGAVSVGSFDGCDSLIIRQKEDGRDCCTYIYYYGGSLMELFAFEDADVTAAFGSKISELDSFEISMPAQGVFRFSCTDGEGNVSSAVVSLKSTER